MQRNYQVIIEYYAPYPLKKEYIIEANNIGLASYRGYKKLKQERKGKHEPKAINIKSTKL